MPASSCRLKVPSRLDNGCLWKPELQHHGNSNFDRYQTKTQLHTIPQYHIIDPMISFHPSTNNQITLTDHPNVTIHFLSQYTLRSPIWKYNYMASAMYQASACRECRVCKLRSSDYLLNIEVAMKNSSAHIVCPLFSQPLLFQST